MCIGEVWVHAADVLTQIRTENAVFFVRIGENLDLVR